MNKIPNGQHKSGAPIDLKPGRSTSIKATPECPAIEIVREKHRGKVRIRVYGPDGMRIKHLTTPNE